MEDVLGSGAAFHPGWTAHLKLRELREGGWRRHNKDENTLTMLQLSGINNTVCEPNLDSTTKVKTFLLVLSNSKDCLRVKSCFFGVNIRIQLRSRSGGYLGC